MKLVNGDALIVVDMQNDFINGSLAVPGAGKIISLVREAVRKFKRAGQPRFFTVCDHPPDHCSFKQWPIHCVALTEGACLTSGIAELVDGMSQIIYKGAEKDKDAYSGFDGTALHAKLQEEDIKQLFICGLATDYCVKATVLDALKLGYGVILICDAIAAVNLEPTDGADALDEMYAAGARARTVKWIEA